MEIIIIVVVHIVTLQTVLQNGYALRDVGLVLRCKAEPFLVVVWCRRASGRVEVTLLRQPARQRNVPVPGVRVPESTTADFTVAVVRLRLLNSQNCRVVMT